MPLSSAERRRASPSQRLLSSLDTQGEARKHPRWTIKRTQTDRKSKQHKHQLGITGPCSTSTFFRGKELFYWVRVRSDSAKDDDILLQNRLGEPFCCILHCLERTEFFWINFLFHGQNFNTCIELGIVPVPLAGIGCNGFCTGQELSSKQPILIFYLSSHIHLFKMADLSRGSFKYL